MSMQARRLQRHIRMPNCTHITMDRYYDPELTCDHCLQRPQLGFLYVCAQDFDPKEFGVPRFETDESSSNLYPPDRPQGLRPELEEVGLSEPVIKLAEAGFYTDKQLDLLRTQKLHLKETIRDHEQRDFATLVAQSLARGPANSDGTSASTLEDEYPTICHFKACHACRPYYEQRIYTSFDAVSGGELLPFTPMDADRLPKKDPRVMRTIGLRPDHCPLDESMANYVRFPTFTTTASEPSESNGSRPSSRTSNATFKTTQSDMAAQTFNARFSALRSRSSGYIARTLASNGTFATHGRQTLRSAIQSVCGKRLRRASSPMPPEVDITEMKASSHPDPPPSATGAASGGSAITLPVSRSGTARDASSSREIKELDIGALRRVRHEQERARHSDWGFETGERRAATFPSDFVQAIPEDAWVSLRPAGQAGEDKDVEEDDASVVSHETVYSCASEGLEVEVTGGVALTEEAVETHTPDIVNLNVEITVGRADEAKQGSPEETTNADISDIDLATIMTQG